MLVTDDSPFQPSGHGYFERLRTLLSNVPFTVHLLGGFEAPSGRLLTPDAPVMSGACWSRDEQIEGVSAGEGYQELAMLSSGLRTSLCYENSRSALAAALLEAPPGHPRCRWPLSANAGVEYLDVRLRCPP